MENKYEEKEICTFLEKKLASFKQYLSITEKMKEALRNKEEHGSLGGLISRRQGCIHKIEKLDLSIDKIIEMGSVGISRISQKYKGVIDSYLPTLKDIMVKVDIMDRELVKIVAEQGEGIKTELLKIRNMRQAARGYKTKRRYPAKFLDTRK